MAIQSVTGESKEYYEFFDSIRIITMLCVVLFHAVIAYSSTTPQFPIHDTDPIVFCDYVRWIFDVFMMPVFFFIAGFFIDRIGPRKMNLFAVTVSGLGLILLSRINSLLTFYAYTQ